MNLYINTYGTYIHKKDDIFKLKIFESEGGLVYVKEWLENKIIRGIQYLNNLKDEQEEKQEKTERTSRSFRFAKNEYNCILNCGGSGSKKFLIEKEANGFIIIEKNELKNYYSDKTGWIMNNLSSSIIF